MLFYFSGKCIEHLTVESTAWTVVFENLNDEASDFAIFDYFLFEVLSADFFNSRCLSYLLSLIEHLQLVV